jgi:response regulator RpfG family c-di-GMP phosphodiesterase
VCCLADEDEKLQHVAQEAGMKEFLTKPVSEKGLKKVFKTAKKLMRPRAGKSSL